MLISKQKFLQHSKETVMKRLQKVEDYWGRTPLEEKKFLMATSFYMDGELTKGDYLNAQLPEKFEVMFNQYVAYSGQPGDHRNMEKALEEKFPEAFRKRKSQVSNRRVACFIPHLEETGGIKMILKHVDLLMRNGFHVDLFIAYPETGTELTHTFFGKEYQLIAYQNDDELKNYAQHYSIALAPHWDHLFVLWQSFDVVFFYSQGDYSTFSMDELTLNRLKVFYWLPHHLYAGSSFLSETMNQKFQRSGTVHPPDVNLELFVPGGKYPKPTVLVVGRIGIVQKQIKETLHHLLELRKTREFALIWVTPEDAVHESPYVKTVNSPSQEELATIYRKSYVFVSASDIEGFSLPPLEAMASGTAVVTTESGGNREYIQHGRNSLVFAQNEWGHMKQYVDVLLSQEEKRNRLVDEGVITASLFQSDKLEEAFIQYAEECIRKPFITRWSG